MTDTRDERVDRQIRLLKGLHPPEVTERDLECWAELLHALRSERNMLAYEKGGHSLWKRYTR